MLELKLLLGMGCINCSVRDKALYVVLVKRRLRFSFSFHFLYLCLTCVV